MLIDSQTGLFAELSPIVVRATQKMSKKYALRLSRRRVVCVEDLENIAWAQVLSKLERIAQIPAGNERSKFVYTLVCHAVHSEMTYIATGFDDAARLTHNGTLDTGAQDSSYDGGTTVFNSGDDRMPAGIQPAEESWTAPVIWIDWQKLDLSRRYKLLEMAGLRGATVLQQDGVRRSCAAAKWNEIPYDYQIEIESAWKRSARGELRKNKHAGKPGHPAYKPFNTTETSTPAPDELARITPPKLRATAILIYGAGLYTEGDGDSINSSEISKILGRSARTIHRDNAELLKLWRAYTTASLDQKRDEKLFPSYPLHTAIADGFTLIGGAQMPVPSNPVLEDVMMTPGRLRSLRLRMKKYHTDFGSAVVTQTIVTPKANIYACGPEPFAFKIIAGFENPIGTSDGHSQTIDAYWNGRGWKAIHAYSEKSSVPKKASPVHPLVWLHDWSQSDDCNPFGDKPARAMLTTSRGISSATYPRTEPPASNSYCVCPLCQHLRKEAAAFFADVEQGRDDIPLNLSPLTTGVLHGQDRAVGFMRYKETHFLGMQDGCELWGIVDEGLPYCYWECIPAIDAGTVLPEGTIDVRGWRQQVTAIRVDDSKWLGVPWLINDRRAKMPWTIFVGPQMTKGEIDALYNKTLREKREKRQRADAADNEATRACNAALWADPERLRESNEQISEAILAVNGTEIAGVK